MASDYYEVLGVSREATGREIKRAFRRLAKELHPDCNGGCDQKSAHFREVAEAYEVLGDPERRSVYDRYGHTGQGAAEGMSGFDFQTVMTDLGSAAAGFGIDFESFFGGKQARTRTRKKGRDVSVKVQVGMLEALRGCEQKVSYRSRRHEGREVRVRIPAGSRTGDNLRVRGRGAPGRSGVPAGDLEIELEVVPMPGLRWDGETLVMDLPITCLEAYRGAVIEVSTPQGRVKLKVPASARSGQKLRLRGKGPQRGGKPVDLIVRLEVAVPAGDDDEVAAALEKVEAAYQGSIRANLPKLS